MALASVERKQGPSLRAGAGLTGPASWDHGARQRIGTHAAVGRHSGQPVHSARQHETRREEATVAEVQLAPVDRVDVLSLMDNSVDVLMASTDVARRPVRRRDEFTHPQLRAEHGVSMLVGVERGARRETFLFDTGVTPDAVAHNLTALEVALGDVRALVLSHGHTDHTGGIAGLLRT